MSSDSAQENISEPSALEEPSAVEEPSAQEESTVTEPSVTEPSVTEEAVTEELATEQVVSETEEQELVESKSSDSEASIFAAEPLNEQKMQNILEAALMAAGQPLSIDRMLTLFVDSNQPSRDEVRAALVTLTDACENRGVELVEVGSGYRYQAKQENAEWVARLWEEKPARYSRALLETLSLIAYRQPITRGEIEDIRGVSVSTNIMKTLMERDWVKIVGHRDVPGKPAMYASTKQFLDYFSLKSLSDLPSLAEIRDIDSINAELDLAEPDADRNKKEADAAAQLALAANDLVEEAADDDSADVDSADETVTDSLAEGEASIDDSAEDDAGNDAGSELEESVEAHAEQLTDESSSGESSAAEQLETDEDSASTAGSA